MLDSADTIVAVSSAAGAAARGIIRLSGTQALSLSAAVFTPDNGHSLRNLPSWKNIPGCCLLEDKITVPTQLFYFRSPASYTTEDMVELHLPGSPPLLRWILDKLVAAGARHAEPGEFTARAFFHGRIDLSEAEAVAEVIHARSDSQLRAAENLLGGALHRRCVDFTRRLGDSLALVEAEIDFSEEEITFVTPARLQEQIRLVLQDIDELLHDNISWDELNHLPQVVLAGPANAGKSSLMNRLLGRDRCIVSTMAGTTRDLLSATLTLPRGQCLLIDSAGLGPVRDPLAGQARDLTCRAIAGCDLLLWVYDALMVGEVGVPPLPADFKTPGNVLCVANKIDLLDEKPENISTLSGIAVSALRGDNIERLKGYIADILADDLQTDVTGQKLALNARQHHCLLEARASLASAMQLLAQPCPPPELLALELRTSLDYLGQISGAVTNEDILTNIFSRFCIGK